MRLVMLFDYYGVLFVLSLSFAVAATAARLADAEDNCAGNAETEYAEENPAYNCSLSCSGLAFDIGSKASLSFTATVVSVPVVVTVCVSVPVTISATGEDNSGATVTVGTGPVTVASR